MKAHAKGGAGEEVGEEQAAGYEFSVQINHIGYNGLIVGVAKP